MRSRIGGCHGPHPHTFYSVLLLDSKLINGNRGTCTYSTEVVTSCGCIPTTSSVLVLLLLQPVDGWMAVVMVDCCCAGCHACAAAAAVDDNGP